ncbi:ABC transporter permease [Sphaerisporangium fuscum]|uniref:ABC transporter permease n=1 Tax=Sphaerisporangium fuscum TaxID=2835868 RepID=UPI001BDCFB66|nr:ABC transporter permease [Sphaerisporangium fuscum]
MSTARTTTPPDASAVPEGAGTTPDATVVPGEAGGTPDAPAVAARTGAGSPDAGQATVPGSRGEGVAGPAGSRPGAGTPAGGAPGRVRGAVRLLGSELGLTFRRPRNVAMLVVLACVPVLLGIVLRIVGGDGEAPSIITQVAGNGLVLTFAAMSLLVQLLLPLAVAIVAGDAIAGEASIGTLRYLLVAPAGRTRLLAVKLANVAVFALAACAVVSVAALVAGFVLFPIGPVTLLSGTSIPISEALVRILIVTGYAAAGMTALGVLGVAVSTLTEVPIGAVAGTVATVIFSQVFGAIPQLAAVRPYLLSSWWSSFDGALRDPVAVDVMGQGLLVFGAYALVFGTIAWARFSGRDITG